MKEAQYSDNSDLDNDEDNIINNENCLLLNLDIIKQYIIEAKKMRELVNEKMKQAYLTRDLLFHQHTITLIANYSQNLSLPYTGNEQPGKTYYFSPVNLFIFGLVDYALQDKKLKAYIYSKAHGQKEGRNIWSYI